MKDRFLKICNNCLFVTKRLKMILLIEDNIYVRENTTEILELAGYNVIAACDGKQGVKLAQVQVPELIICDIMMPELDGYGVLSLLKKDTLTAGIPFIFLSAKEEVRDSQKSKGADAYLTKPFDDKNLLDTIEACLKKK